MNWLTRSVRVAAAVPWLVGGLLLGVAAAGGPEPTPEPPPGGLCVEGVLTAEGVECPALRARDGVLYTLTGDLGRFQPGDRVRACGLEALMSICMQGRTLGLTSIGEGRE
jgi:hypothetical protein